MVTLTLHFSLEKIKALPYDQAHITFIPMKSDIHPPYYTQVKVTCACGHTFMTGSTAKEIHVEVCSNCHPFYTGKQKLVDVAGRVDKFRRRLNSRRSPVTRRSTRKAAPAVSAQ